MNTNIKHYCPTCDKETEHTIMLLFHGMKFPVVCSQCTTINGRMHLGKAYCNDD
jgi:hypothetical protein